MFYGTQKLYCPVHPDDDGFLGNRKKDVPTWLKCDECNVYHYFPAHATTPTKSSKTDPGLRHGGKKYCDRDGCICRA